MVTTGYEFEGFAEARAMARRRRRRILLPLAVVAIMLLALIGIAIHNYWAMRRAYDYYRVEHSGHRNFELNGRRYISSVSSLERLLARDWAVLLVVPEDDFVGFVGDNVRKTLIMGLSTVALAGLLAWLLIRQGLRTDRAAMRVLEREAELEAEAQAFGQLASAGSVPLDPGNPSALRPLTESGSEAARVRRVSVWHLAPAPGGLTCLDCYDRDTGGHTHGTRLARQDYLEFITALEAEPVLATVDAGEDVRLASLYRHYLQPLGCRALASHGIDPIDLVTIPRAFAVATSAFLLTLLFVHTALWSGYLAASLAGLTRYSPDEFMAAVLGIMALNDYVMLIVKPLLTGYVVGYLSIWFASRIERGPHGIRRALPKAFATSLIATIALGALITALL